MHETAIALAILDAARRAVAPRGGGRIQRVMVAIGELASVDPDLLRYAWEATGEAAKLEVQWCPVSRFCPRCSEEKLESRGSWMQLCAECDTPLSGQGGRELDLLTVEFAPATPGENVPADCEVAGGGHA